MNRKIFHFSLVVIALYLVLALAFYNAVASRVPGANDFYSRWMGARALFLEGKDPYSDTVTREIQVGMYGRPARTDEDQVAFAYPLYAAFFAAPLVTLPYAWAESFWIAFLVMALAGASIMFGRWVEWSLAPVGLVALLALTLAFYPALRGIFLGQFTLLVFASIAIGVVLIARERYSLAGWVFSISTVKPHMALIALLVILSWAAWHRRWRVLQGFLSAMTLLLVCAYLFLPNWLGEFIGAIGAYQSYIQIGPPVQVLSELLFTHPWSIVATDSFSILLFGSLIYRWWRTIAADWKSYLPTVELALIVSTAAMIRTATTDQTLLLLPWLHWLACCAIARRRVWAIIIGLSLVVVPWVVFLYTLYGNQEAPIATTTVVTLTLIGYVTLNRRELSYSSRIKY